MLPFPEEELAETAVKAWKRYFLTELQTNQPLLILCLLLEVKNVFLFYNDRAVYWACAGKEKCGV